MGAKQIIKTKKSNQDDFMTFIDASAKFNTFNQATAVGVIELKPQTISLIREGAIAKGDTLNIAKISGILAAKKTSELIPLCPPLPLTDINVDIKIKNESTIEVTAIVKTITRITVEIEALTAVSVALLTIWDMTKQYEKDTNGQYLNTADRKSVV